MTETISPQQHVELHEQYSKWINRSLGAGVGSFFVATAVWILTDEPLVLLAGLALYWIGCLGMAIGYWHSPVSMRDELEQRIERDAAQLTVLAATVATITGLPGIIILDAAGVYTAPAAFWGAIWGYGLLVMIFAAVHWLVGQQYA